MATMSSSALKESIFMDTILSMMPDQQQSLVTELEAYFSRRFPCLDGNVLAWWKVMDTFFPQLQALISTSNAETCCRLPNFISHCPGHPSHPWGKYICWVAILKQQAYIVWFTILNDGCLCIEDSCCQGVAEAWPQQWHRISGRATNSPLNIINYEYNMSTIQYEYSTITYGDWIFKYDTITIYYGLEIYLFVIGKPYSWVTVSATSWHSHCQKWPWPNPELPSPMLQWLLATTCHDYLSTYITTYSVKCALVAYGSTPPH